MIKIFNDEQGSPGWFEARRGIPTASQFQCILAKSADRKGRRTYLYDLAAEIIRGECAPTYSNEHMERGHIQESEARDWYAFATDAEPTRVGFIRNDQFRAGVSPDSLIGDDGGLEIKTRLPRLQLELLETKELPNEHKAQVQGALWLTGRKWWDFLSYCPKLKPFKIRVLPDESYIATLRGAVAEFNAELKLLVDKHR